MKTLIVYEDVNDAEGRVEFFLTDGDRSELHNCWVGTADCAKFAPKVREEVGNGPNNEHWTEVRLPLLLAFQQHDVVVVECGVLA